MPAANGFVLGRGFDALNDGDTSAVYRFAVALAVIEAVRMAMIHFAAIMWTKAWVHMQTILRGNLLVGQMASGGPEAGQPVGSAGEALTHFRDDAEDVAQLIDGIVDVSGGLMFSVGRRLILGLADARAAAVLVIPLVGVVLVTRAVDSKVKEYRAADREATGAVTGLVGDMMAAADHGQGERGFRAHARPAQGARRPAWRHRGPRPGAQRERVRVQPRRRRRRLRADLHRQRRRDRLGLAHRRDAGAVRRVRRLAQLPAAG